MTATLADRSAAVAPGGPVTTAVRDTLPLALPLAPFAIAVGSATAASGIPLLAGTLGGVLLLAGSAQLVLTETLGSGGGLVAAAGVAALVNVRFVLYSAGLAHWFSGGPRWRTLLLAVPLVDQTFLLCERAFAAHPDHGWRWRYYVGLSAVLAGVFLSFQPVGYLLGDVVPAGAGLEMAAPLAFAGMLGSALKRRVDVVAGAVAAVVVVVGAPLPAGLALPVAAVAGIVAGSVHEARS